jgi:hippurate hydrolase
MTFDPVAFRRKLHAAPELSREEHATSALIAGLLEDWGYEVARGVGGTGIVATLSNGAGERTIGLRADMDALPIAETTGVPYASGSPGVMHACGHDGHMAILLAAAKELADKRDFSGTVRLIFQPAEEVGGAVEMIADGLFERFPVDAIFAMHNWPGIPAGEFRFTFGPTMASVDWIIITIKGHGGHGALPHDAVDPIVAASSLVMALQTIVARNVDPMETAVVSVCMIHGGTQPNVIPDKVELQLTTRAFSDKVRDRIRDRIKVLAEGHAASYGATAEVNHPPGFPALINPEEETAFAQQVAIRHFGEDRVATVPPRMVSEDFAFMLEKKAGSYLFVGNGPSAELHSPRYDFNDAIIEPAARYWVALVRDYLAANRPTRG